MPGCPPQGAAPGLEEAAEKLPWKPKHSTSHNHAWEACGECRNDWGMAARGALEGQSSALPSLLE